jgi:hypothetical protein
MRTLVIVDAENVRRSTWPNVLPTELVARVAAWAAGEALTAVVVFDGDAPNLSFEHVRLEGSGAGSADDRIVELASAAAGIGDTVWLATSDRELRRRVGADAARVIGGGSFLRDLPRA